MPDPADQTNKMFSMETSTFVFEQNADIYMLYGPDIKLLNEYRWSMDGTFKPELNRHRQKIVRQLKIRQIVRQVAFTRYN